jgi:uncharacterized protein YjiS (DUF1127 family)
MGTIGTIVSPSGEALAKDERGFFPRFTWRVASRAGWIGGILERRRTRLALLDLTDEQLNDIGLSRADAYREADRSITVAIGRSIG